MSPLSSSLLLILILLLLLVRDAEASWGAGVKYAVNCPERCDVRLCGGGAARCRRGTAAAASAAAATVLDDCGCCQVCAARRGEHCYRTVSGMHGVKCGPGLRCEFYKDEDDYGDEYGVCKDCAFGTYGVECRKTCSCKGGLCDRETGVCLTFNFFTKIASKLRPTTGAELGSGEVGNDQNPDRTAAPKSRTPR